MSQFTAAEREVGRRLDVVLAEWTKVSRSQAARMIDAGLVAVNGQSGKARRVLEAGDVVVLEAPPDPQPAELPDVPIVYQDDDLIIVDKPAGVLAHPAGGRPDATVADVFRGAVEDDDPDRPGIVHRLDRDTSGLLILARQPAAKAYMQDLFKKRRVEKTYLALVTGHPTPVEAVVDLPLGRSTKQRTKRIVDPTGRVAATRYTTMASYPGFSLLEVQPLTGRTHQIRAHMKALGHPVAGDSDYGAPKGSLGLQRQFLHATRLRFVSPSGRPIDVTSPLPADLAAALERLEQRGRV